MNFQSVKLVRSLLIFIALCSVGVPSFRLYQEISRLSLNTRWDQRLDPNDSETQILKQFVTRLQDKIHSEYRGNLRNADNSIPALSKCDENTLSAWKIKKTESDLTVNYSCLRLVDFYTEGKSVEEIKQKRDKQKSNLVFRRFDNLRKNRFLPALGPVKVAEDSIIAHTRSILSYFGEDDILNDIPALRVDSVYMFHENSQVMAIYPNLINQDYDNKNINYQRRPWYESVGSNVEGIDDQNLEGYATVYFRSLGRNRSGLTGIYIDISDDNQPNLIRTLWYRFKGADGQYYIFALDLFMDKSGAFSGGNSWVSLFWLSTPF